MTPQEHLSEIARLADEMRPHLEAIPGAFTTSININGDLSVQFSPPTAIDSLTSDATWWNQGEEDGMWRHCKAKVGNVTLCGCQLVEAEVPADV